MSRFTCLSIALLVLGPGLWIAGCAAPEPVPLASLADQLDPDASPGPWRPAARPGLDPAWFAEAQGLAVIRDGVRRPATELAGEDPEAIRTLIRSGALVQTQPLSTLTLQVPLQAGEWMEARLRYPRMKEGSRGRWEPEGVSVNVLQEGEEGLAGRILRVGEVRASRIGDPPGECVQRGTLVPAGGADRIEIVHKQAPGTSLKLLSADILLVAAGEPVSERGRARRFLGFGGGDTSQLFHGAAVRRLVRVSRFGMTARCAVLAPGDSLEFDLPSGGAVGRLDFSSLRPPGEKDLDARLKLEREYGGTWTSLICWRGDGLPAGEWRHQSIDLFRRGPIGGRVRLTHAGPEGAIGIAEPVLLPPEGRAVDAPNLVLVVLDTLRADRLGCYGYTTRPTSERLDRSLEEWGFALFRHAYSGSSWTIPATAKFMASRYLDFHGMRQIPESTTMLAEFLRRKGYYCAAFTGGGMVAVPGMEQGFHEYRWSSGFGKVEGSFPQAGEWLRQWNGGPFFLFVHTYETHRPYTRDTFCRDLPRGRLGDLAACERLFNREASTVAHLTGEERDYVQAAYDSGVFHACEATAGLLETLDECGLRRRTVVVILSDHGEELWDRNPVFGAHGHSLHAELLDVPLLVHSAETNGRGLRVLEDEVSTVDLPPTVAGLLGLTWEGRTDGVSLQPLLSGGEIQRTLPIIADLQRARLHREILPQACVILGGVKYIEPLAPDAAIGSGPFTGVVAPVVPALYRLSGDPGERWNLAGTEALTASRMRDLLFRSMRGALQPDGPDGPLETEENTPLSGELEEQLRSLGYLD